MNDESFDQNGAVNSDQVVVMQPVHKKLSTKIVLFGLTALVAIGAITAFATLMKPTNNPVKTVTTKKATFATVYITSDGFVPANLNVPKNTVVVWTNKDTVAHDLSLIEGTGLSAASSQTLAPKESFSITTSDAKTYHFDSPSSGQNFQGLITVSSKE